MDSLFLNLSSRTCRACLQNNDSSNSLYDEVEYDEPLELRELLRHITNVIVPVDDAAPTRLCFDCTEKLLNAYDFVCTIKRSEKLLNDYKQKQKHKVEVLEEDNVSIEENQNLEVLDDEFQLLEYEECKEDNYEDAKCSELAIDMSDVDIKNIDIESTESQNELNRKSPSFVLVKVLNDQVCTTTRKNLFAKTKYNCERCQRSFAKEETLQRHIEKSHTFPTTDNTTLEKNHLRCSHCPRTFARRDTLHRHQLAMHADEQGVTKQYNLKHTYKRGLCPYCGESFSQASLIIHIRRHTGETPYKCDECEKGFPRRQDLIIHKRQHTGERPHKCSICGKSFIRPNKLARHLRIHTGQRPYKCTECDKGFAQSNDLKIHMRRHTGEKPYKCNVCGVGFICGAALKTHRRSKGHLDDAAEVDPYASCRVNNRVSKDIVRLQDLVEAVDDDEVVQD